MEIILASQSPRRRELLERMGLSFSVRAADIDEAMEPGKDPAQEVARVSRAKAMAAPAGPQDVVIAADTIVVCAFWESPGRRSERRRCCGFCPAGTIR